MIKSKNCITIIALVVTIVLIIIMFSYIFFNGIGYNSLSSLNVDDYKKYSPSELITCTVSLVSYDDEYFYFLIKFVAKDDNKIQTVEFPLNQHTINTNKKNKISIDYKILQEEIHSGFPNCKITLDNGTEIEFTPEYITPTTQRFDYTSSRQLALLTPGQYTVECFGARGGNGYGKSVGGLGGHITGTMTVTDTSVYQLYVGQAGQDGGDRRESFNGGAIGGDDYYGANEFGGAGGGATDIRLTSDLSTRIIVAGGGRRCWRLV